MGYISIFLGLAVVVALMIRRWSPLMVGIVAATVVIFMNGLPFGETMTGTYFDGFCTMFKSLFPPIFSGSLLAQIYNRSGAVNAVGDAIANALFKDSASATRKYVSCILAMAIASGILAFCGLNALVTLIAMYPIALRLMERAGIPKRFVMGILSCGVYTFAMSAPGSAELVNILAMQSLNTPSYAGICGGILACITEIAVTTTLTTIMIKKDVAKGKTFAYGPKDIVASNDQPRPKALVALLPLLALVLLFNIFSIDIFSSTMIAWLFSIVLFWKYLPKKDGKRTNEMLDVFTAAGAMAFGPCSAVGSIVGFTSIVQTLPEFQAISDTMSNALFKEGRSKTRTYVSCILAIVIPTGLLAYCGMNGLVTLIAFYPIALGLMERAGIPKRYVMGLLSFGVYAFALTGPGTAQLVNVLSMQVVGEGPAAGLVGGLVGVVVEIVFGTFVLTLMIKKDVAKGLKFAYGPNDIRVADDKQLPNFLISLIPLLSVVIFFNVVKLDIFSSCLAAWLLSIILLGKYMPKKDGSLLKELLDVCTVSGTNAFGPCGMVGSLFGFVSVVQTLPEFQAILNYIFSLNMAPFLVLILSINIVGALTGSSSSAIRIGMPMAMQHCIDAGMSLAFVQRLGAFAASILDTLPHSSAIIINLGIADQDMKEAYPPMAVTTILTTAVGTAAVAIFMSLFPSLP